MSQKTGQYYHVPGGVIIDGPRSLPRKWKTADRTIPGFNKQLDATLRVYDWLPEMNNKDSAFNPATEVWEDPPTQDIQSNKVLLTYTKRNKTAQELSDEKDAIADVIMSEPGVVALAKALNDGSWVPGSNYSNAQMKAKIRAVL